MTRQIYCCAHDAYTPIYYRSFGCRTRDLGLCQVAGTHGILHCYAQDERTVRLGAFECEGGSSDVCLATAASDEE